MQNIRLGSTGLEVSPICIGCMGFGDPATGHPTWAIGEEKARLLIKHALDAGINFFDTANLYSKGTSEQFVGKALKDMAKRENIVISTKLGAPMRPGPNSFGLSRKAIMTEIDHSLKRLGTDYIDLYQIHRADPFTPWEETLEALHDLVKMGKVRYLGASTMRTWQFAKALHLQKMNGWSRFISMQHNYNLIAREEENEMFPLCEDNGIQTLIYSPLARGRLARPWGEASVRSEAEPAAAKLYEATALADEKIVGAIGEVAKERGVSQAVISLAWIYRNPVVAAPIVGALQSSHIDDAVQALSIKLTDEEAGRLEAEYTPRVDPAVINSDPKGIAKTAASVGLQIPMPLIQK
ncbi:aldo/keto reductase [Paenibacillus glycanilyticus]|uniref:NADP-dependent aryl-alcohol dehydrogenase n=1 Tax=Paenibacillus glycanilyticus TaxID=126569 RepID=A0ABQ6GHB5_9BACL|nr:aldo/keto reductase [Paenibacillus glycanilyticus]GLX69623.1 NADP-dependent aryl-alcohol dehydrogenase [Paenibacillus glycanilyticus]